MVHGIKVSDNDIRPATKDVAFAFLSRGFALIEHVNIVAVVSSYFLCYSGFSEAYLGPCQMGQEWNSRMDQVKFVEDGLLKILT